jgi:hypothetical protein
MRQIIVKENARGGTIHVFILARAHGPKKSYEPQKAKAKRDRHEVENDAHHTTSFAAFPRNAFSVTRMEEPDMAAAAINGVT